MPYNYNNWEPVDSNGYKNIPERQPTHQIYPVYQPSEYHNNEENLLIGYQNSEKNPLTGYQNNQEHYTLGSQNNHEHFVYQNSADSPSETYYSFKDQETIDQEYNENKTNLYDQSTVNERVDEESMGSSLFNMIG